MTRQLRADAALRLGAVCTPITAPREDRAAQTGKVEEDKADAALRIESGAVLQAVGSLDERRQSHAGKI